ncbi:AI-2E family transporter [Litchfieldia salsa]|uniref:Predicted PurR-regulated permease PerM n=1 Tax=Litchfieldia salsa TaxID=930152 RepID=A0A1H0Q5S1_9BACI|nr:AI-2E family transporter [Litchfieldia salsa]SDP12674.1 Predicted PurR-regulated permease PerM [Litchfieldia salsa]
MWIKHPFFKYMSGITLVLFTIYLLSKVQFIFEPINSFITILFFPLILSGFLYYLLKPVVNLLSKVKFIPRTLAVVFVFLSIIGSLVFGGFSIGDQIVTQVQQFEEDIPSLIDQNEEMTKELINTNSFGFYSYDEGKQTLLNYIENQSKHLSEDVTNILASLANFFTVLLVVPFILFYFLKDGHQLQPFLLHFLPDKHKEEGRRLLNDIDKTLSTYIGGQMMVALVNGLLMYIGYLIIGLDYALVLAIIITLTAVIPIIGPALGILPAILVALVIDPFMILQILILLLIVQQLEGNIIAPLIIGNKLSIHPLTVILLLLTAGTLYGFIGILIAVPFYSVIKVTIKNIYRFYHLHFAE